MSFKKRAKRKLSLNLRSSSYFPPPPLLPTYELTVFNMVYMYWLKAYTNFLSQSVYLFQSVFITDVIFCEQLISLERVILSQYGCFCAIKGYVMYKLLWGALENGHQRVLEPVGSDSKFSLILYVDILALKAMHICIYSFNLNQTNKDVSIY